MAAAVYSDLALRIEHLSKTFPGTRALDDVSIHIERGSIHCLVGGNGSGKSSLIKILAGVYQGDSGGTISVGEMSERAERASPEWAKSAGLRFVHQDLALFDGLSVAENLAIGSRFPMIKYSGSIRWRALVRHSAAVLERFGIDVSPNKLVGRLRPAERTMIAIARALQDQSTSSSSTLVLDEVTVALPVTEVDVVLSALRSYTESGHTTALFVTHRLEEVLRIADRVTVLKDGAVVTTTDSAEMTEDRLVELIVGRALDRGVSQAPPSSDEEAVIKTVDLCGGPLRGVNLALHKGEVLGLAGLAGSGRTTLLQMLFGASPIAHGSIELDGKEVRFANVDKAMDAGLAFVPGDRSESAFIGMDVRENLSAADVSRYWNWLYLRNRKEAQDAKSSMEEFDIKAYSDRQPFGTLSGGNQQKAVLARWLRRKPKVLLLDEPTQGVDVAARSEIYKLIRQAVAGGTSVIVATSDFEELARVVDRVLVLAHGTIAAELRSPDIDPSRITELVLSKSSVAVSGPVAH